MHRVAVLVIRKSSLDSAQFTPLWLDTLAPAIAAAVSRRPGLRRVVVNVVPEQMDTEVARVFPPLFDGLLEFWFDGPDAAAATLRELSRDEHLRTLAAGIVDGSRGVAWLAKVVESKPESGTRIKFLAAGDVAESMSLEDAHTYWANTHPLVAQTAPDVWNRLTRYTQFHGTKTPQLDMGDWLAKGRFVPMCSDMGFAQQRDFIELYTCEQYTRIVRPDEEKFSRPGEMLAFVSAEERELLLP